MTTHAMDFEALANEHKDAIYRQMLRVCGNREDAEDVLVEALLSAYRSMDQLREPAAFRGWLAQIARRVCFQLKEREALQPLVHLDDAEGGMTELPHGGAGPEEMVSAAQLRGILRGAVEALPEEFRRVYTLRDVEELPGEEVAARMGLSVAAMKSRLHRARGMLREQLEQTLLARRPV
jgi:RNA polymerase sigma-70 factor (ECF subfamily)